MNTIPNRLVIYTKDVSNITGLRQRASRKLLAAIRQANNKTPWQFYHRAGVCCLHRIKEDAWPW